MKKRQLFSVTLAFLNPIFSEEKEINDPYFDSIAVENHSSEKEESNANENLSSPNGDALAVENHSNEKEESSENEKLPSPNCDTFHRMHIGLRHTEARGVGYNDGYTTLEGFGIYDRNRALMPFLDIRGHVFDNGQLAGSGGIGARSYFSSVGHLLGYYCYYDVREDNHHLTAQQVSPGIELLSKRMEYRINGYFPVGEDKSHQYSFKFDQFDGHRIILKSKQKRVLTGGDAEIGAHLTQSLKYDVYLGAGPYYFSSSHASSWGGKARLLGRYKEYISLEASYSYDHLFRNIVQGTIALNLPFGCKLKRKEKDCSSRNNLVLSRAAFSPYRFEIPVIKRVSRKGTAINPATNAPWRVWFVNNTSSSNGTFESPFPTLIQAQNASAPNDMIYVFPGDGTTKGMNVGISLQDAQTFFGSGIAHKIQTTKGSITIPAFSQAFPSITNATAAGNVIIPANGNAISGFNIFVTVPGNSAVFSPNSIRGITMDHNNVNGNIAAPGSFGIVVQGAGEMIISDNRFLGNGTQIAIALTATNGEDISGIISNNMISAYNRAISIVASGNMTITNNQLLGPGNVANSQGIRLTTINGKALNGIASNNAFSNYVFGYGMNLTNNASANFEISNNAFSNISNTGIFWGTASGTPQLSQVLISGNSISNSVGTVGVGMNIGGFNSSTQIIGNTISSFQSQGILMTKAAPNATTEIIGNVINNPVGGANSNAIAFSVSQTPNAGKVIISDNQVITTTSATGTSGILTEITATPGSAFNSFITNNQVTISAGTGLPAVGINVRTGTNGIICTGISNNQLTVPPGATGVNAATTGTGVINIDDFSNNTDGHTFTGNVNQVAPGTCGDP